jgi:hypothetical protein
VDEDGNTEFSPISFSEIWGCFSKLFLSVVRFLTVSFSQPPAREKKDRENFLETGWEWSFSFS